MTTLQIDFRRNEFDELFIHIETYRPNYRNMHLRETRVNKGEKCLRYLHMVRIKDATTIEGAVSGPNIEAHYELLGGPKRVAVKFLRFRGSPKETARLQRRLAQELLSRVKMERGYTGIYGPKRLPGQYYLRRSMPGMEFNHPKCQRALKERVLHPFFLQRLEEWKLRLLYREN